MQRWALTCSDFTPHSWGTYQGGYLIGPPLTSDYPTIAWMNVLIISRDPVSSPARLATPGGVREYEMVADCEAASIRSGAQHGRFARVTERRSDNRGFPSHEYDACILDRMPRRGRG